MWTFQIDTITAGHRIVFQTLTLIFCLFVGRKRCGVLLTSNFRTGLIACSFFSLHSRCRSSIIWNFTYSYMYNIQHCTVAFFCSPTTPRHFPFSTILFSIPLLWLIVSAVLLPPIIHHLSAVLLRTECRCWPFFVYGLAICFYVKISSH